MKTWKRRLLKTLIGLVLVLVVLPSVLLLVVTRPAFIKSQIIPRVSRQLGVPITVGELAFSPFSQVELRDVVVGEGDDALFRAELVRCRYRVLPLLKREVVVDEALLRGATARLIQDAQGAWNLPESSTPSPPAGEEPKPARGGAVVVPVRLRVSGVRVEDLSLLLDMAAGEGREAVSAAITSLNFELPELANGATAKMKWDALVRAARGSDVKVESCKLMGTAEIALNAEALPTSVALAVTAGAMTGAVHGIDLAGRESTLRINAVSEGGLTKWRLEEAVIEQSQAGETLARVSMTGAFAADPLEAQLELQVEPLAPAALNLVGGLIGDYDFGETSVRYNGRIGVRPGPVVRSKGSLQCLDASFRSVKLGIPALPPFRIDAEHEASVDVGAKSASISLLTGSLRQEGRPVAALALSDPVMVTWGDTADATKASTARVELTADAFPLQLANAFIPADTGTKIGAGTLSAKITAQIGDMGRDVRVEGHASLDGLDLDMEGFDLRPLTVRESFTARLSSFERLELTSSETEVLVGGKSALKVTNKANLHLKDLSGSVETLVEHITEDVLACLPADVAESVPVSSLLVNARSELSIGRGGKAARAQGRLGVMRLTAQLPGYEPLTGTQTELDYDISYAEGEPLSIARVLVALSANGQNLAQFSLTGSVAMPPTSGRTEVTIGSEGVDLKRLEGLLKKTEAGEAPAAEPAPAGTTEAPTEPQVDLKGIHALAHLDLKNVTYGAIEVGAVTGTLELKDGVFRAHPLDVILNGAPIHVEQTVDLSVPGFTYDGSVRISQLPFDPFVRTFAPELAGKVDGSLTELTASAKGRGVTPANLLRNLESDVAVHIGRLTVPTNVSDLRDKPLIRLLTLPLRLLAQAGQLPGASALADGVAMVRTQTEKAVTSLDSVEFTSGRINVAARGGKVMVPECLFAGKRVPRLTFTGTVDFSPALKAADTSGSVFDPMGAALNLEAGLMVGEVPVTIPITGTLGAPSADNRQLVASLTKGVAKAAATSALKVAMEAAAKGKEVHGKDLLRSVLNDAVPGLVKPDSEAEKPKPAPAEGEATAEGTAPAEAKPAPAPEQPEERKHTRDIVLDVLGGALQKQQTPQDGQPAPAPPPEGEDKGKPEDSEDARRKARNDAVKDIGGALLRGLLQPKK